jgi:hypothetical protein
MKLRALSIVGASRENGKREADDFYPTPAYVVEELLKREVFEGVTWECACGEGDISKVLISNGIETISTDLIDRGYGIPADFFTFDLKTSNIITNPPFKYAKEFVERAKLQTDGKIAMFLKTVFLEGASRYSMFNDSGYPLKVVYQFSKRVTLTKGGHKNEE